MARKRPSPVVVSPPEEKAESEKRKAESGEEESEDEQGSILESDSDKTTTHSPTASDFTIKPVVSIKPKKPGSKRLAETEQNGKESLTKKSKISNGDEEEKRSAVNNRLWSEDDQIAILKGIIDYKSKKGADPCDDMCAFHEFLKKSLSVDVSVNQLKNEIRRLKKKYQKNVEKAKELEEKWNNMLIDEIKLYLNQVEFMKVQTKMLLDALKSSKC